MCLMQLPAVHPSRMSGMPFRLRSGPTTTAVVGGAPRFMSATEKHQPNACRKVQAVVKHAL
eukprot:2529195-Amphidinium_carterae.1